MERYVCIHGHFYQPPRENAWSGLIERQDSAYPCHDWTERVAAECYLPNAFAPVLDDGGYIDRIVNNYAGMSFDFGPTLLDWLEKNRADVYRAIIEADKEGRQRFSGHGGAMASVYNHVIMPLANRRDRYTQVYWGIRDFERRFGRPPEGMWLPETAVDLETLDIIAEEGIKFTILAPHQAGRIRKIGMPGWQDVSGGKIDITRAYLVKLPSGRGLGVFFYNGAIAGEVSFTDILKSGEAFVKRLTGAFPDTKEPRLVHIATDGENYGHHHHRGDVALAYALDNIEKNNLAKVTNYGEFLEKYPPDIEVQVVEKSSWSCTHGVDRWWSDCGDKTGAGSHPDWNQKWRTPLRNAFDRLRDGLSTKYEEKARPLLKDPWAARDGYIDVVLDRSPGSVDRFFARHSVRPLSGDEKAAALKLLEMQRYAMLMYTSDGWFFDELSRPEPLQVMQYAGHAAQLARELFGDGTEAELLEMLAQAKSNLPSQGDGRRIYENMVRPAIDRAKSGVSYDEQRLFLDSAVEMAATGIEVLFNPLFKELFPMERFSAELGGPVPRILQIVAELTINNALRRAVRDDPPDAALVRESLDAAAKWQINIDDAGIAYEFRQALEKMMAALASKPSDLVQLKNLVNSVALARSLPFEVDLRKAQKIFRDLMTGAYPQFKQDKEWADKFISLGKQLNIRVP
jgi:alpha-amylase/alpha-mannosidase (GH57 family)